MSSASPTVALYHCLSRGQYTSMRAFVMSSTTTGGATFTTGGFAASTGDMSGLPPDGVPVFASLLIGHTLLVLPYVIRVISAALTSFDFSIEEAAVSLGSHPVKTFFTIVLPNVRSGVIAAFILAFITSINDVSVSPIQILAHVEQFFDPTVASVSVLLMMLTIIVMIIVERTLGLTVVAK